MATKTTTEPILCKHGVHKNIFCSKCDVEVKARLAAIQPAAPITQALICTRFVFKAGQGHMDVTHVKENFQLAPYVNIVKGCGGVMTDKVHVPWENILAVLVFEDPSELQQMSAEMMGAGGPASRKEIN